MAVRCATPPPSDPPPTAPDLRWDNPPKRKRLRNKGREGGVDPDCNPPPGCAVNAKPASAPYLVSSGTEGPLRRLVAAGSLERQCVFTRTTSSAREGSLARASPSYERKRETFFSDPRRHRLLLHHYRHYWCGCRYRQRRYRQRRRQYLPFSQCRLYIVTEPVPV